MDPVISVIMPVLDCEEFVGTAIESILCQSFQDFEFIIIDDGSTDKSREIISSYCDKRILLLKNKANLGNYSSRNMGIERARGKYICVMDADDISEPDRLDTQFRFMEENPKTGIAGSFIKNIPSNIIPRFVTETETLRVLFLSNNYCSHPSLIMRKGLLDNFGLRYNTDYYYSADYDLCARGLRYFNICNIPSVLLQYRRHSSQISCRKAKEQERYADMIRISQIQEILDFKIEEIPVLLHLLLMKRQPIASKYKKYAEEWIRKILSRNVIMKYFNQEILHGFLNSSLGYCLQAGCRVYPVQNVM
jgi:glycosyltransferase involved in cell wall biosynthesis